jgi:hypothetical protein
MKRSAFLIVPILAAVIMCALAVMPGCAKTPQAKIDQAEVLYGTTLDGANQAYKAGLISPEVKLKVIDPLRKTARTAIDDAKRAYSTGNLSAVDVLITTARDALLQIEAAKANHPATRPSSIGPTAPPLPMPVSASAGAIGLALELLVLINKLAPVAQKLVAGEELTPEERALAEQHSADATAEADRLSADAAAKLG